MITLSKLAKLAHVSVSTASKAFTMSNEVNEQTREEIFKVAKELGCFRKFYNAKYPKYMIAVICPELKSLHYSFALSTLQENLSIQNCEICVATTNFSLETEKLLLEYYHYHTNVDAIVVIQGKLPLTDSYEVPIIAVDSTCPQPNIVSIRPDYEASVAKVIEHFAKHGITNIGYLGETKSLGREIMFKEIMTKKLGGYNENHIIVSDQRFQKGGYAAMEELLKQKELPRALICAYDYFAIGAIRCILDHGMSVPEDFLVIGFDDLPEAKYLNPPLSSISPLHEEVYKTAANSIVKLINNEMIDMDITIGSKLYLRESSKIEDRKKR